MRVLPRFRLRTLMILIMICCVLLAWLALEIQRARKQQNAAKAVTQLGANIYYDYQFPDSNTPVKFEAPSQIPAFVRSIFGDGMFSDVTYLAWESNTITNDDLRLLSEFPRLKKLHLAGNRISEEGLVVLSELDELEEVSLGMEMTDSGLDHLAGIRSMQELFILGPKKGSPFVFARDPEKRISTYYEYQSQVTRAGAERLGEKLPECRIVY